MKRHVSGVPYPVELPGGVNPKQFGLGVLVGCAATSLVAIALYRMQPDPVMITSELVPADIIVAYNRGIEDALKTNPASWDLEQTCLELWANKQPIEAK